MRRWLALALVALSGCNDILGIADVTVGSGESSASKSDDSGTSIRVPTDDSGGGGGDLPVADAAPIDSGGSSSGSGGVRQPDPACLKSTNPQNAIKRVELDTSPAPTSDGVNHTGMYSIYGDNNFTGMHLDFCTPDGARVDVGGGIAFISGGGAVTRRWQTKGTVTLPVGKVQAQVRADGTPELKLVYDIELR